MAELSFVATLVARTERHTRNLTDFAVLEGSDGPVLIAASGSGGTYSSFRLSTADKPAQLGGVHTSFKSGSIYDAPGVDVIDHAGRHYLLHTGAQGSIHKPMALTDKGGLGGFQSVFGPRDIPGDVVAVKSFSAGGQDYLLAGRSEDMRLTLYRHSAGGLAEVGTAASRARAGPNAEYDDIDVMTISGKTYAFAASTQGNRVSVFSVGSNGLSLISEIDDKNQIGITAPREVAAVSTDAGRFLIVTAGTSDSITVLRIGGNGSLTLHDHVIDSHNTRFESATAMDSVELDGRAYIVVGGGDDGISVFTLDPQGRLILLAALADTDGMALADVSAIEAHVINGKIAIFVASASEAGVTQLSFDPGDIGESVVGRGRLQGTSDDDILVGQGAGTVVSGGAGDDILVARSGEVTLRGGAGADRFMPAYGAETVLIQDFELGRDQLDLSELAFIRSMAQLRVIPTAKGCYLLAGPLQIEIQTRTGTTLTEKDFSEEMFRLAHYANDIDFDKLVDPVKPDPGEPSTPPSGGGSPSGPDGRFEPPPPLPPAPSGANPDMGTPGQDRMIMGNSGGAANGRGGHDIIVGGRGGDHIVGLDGDDSLYGKAGHDFLLGGAGDDKLLGHANDDRLRGHEGNDSIWGGSGNDRAWGGRGNDKIFGGAGDEVLFGGAGNDTINGGPGNDLILGGRGRDMINGHNGHDKIISPGDGQRISGGAGNDWIRIWGRNNVVDAGFGNDTVTGGLQGDLILLGFHNDKARGRAGNDTIRGGFGDDLVLGNHGNDSLTGDQGNDTVLGGQGNDMCRGDNGDDILKGESGNDTLEGGTGNDTMDGGVGADIIRADAGNDSILGGSGDDEIWGGLDDDHIHGGEDDDKIWGEDGADTLIGFTGADTLDGGGGNDLLLGEGGNDRLIGGGGNDTLIGGAGADVLTGGSGADVFVFKPSDGSAHNRITDFVSGEDVLDLTAFGTMVWMDDASFSGSGRSEIRMRDLGTVAEIQIDLNGDGDADLRISCTGDEISLLDILF